VAHDDVGPSRWSFSLATSFVFYHFYVFFILFDLESEFDSCLNLKFRKCIRPGFHHVFAEIFHLFLLYLFIH
jgi:NADH:ubiquinone oxidoreductase subunit 3 (subunit A)